jgi:hypothetical protein
MTINEKLPTQGLFSNVPASTRPSVPDYLKERVASDKPGRGISRDNTTTFRYPLAKILQTNSPECNSRSPDYVAGAKPGHFLLGGTTPQVRDGVAGIEVVIAYSDVVHIEWKANREGFAALHFARPDDVHGIDNGRRTQYFRDNGNEVVRTGRIFFLLENAIYELDLKSTGLTVFGNLNGRFDSYRDEKDQPVPCYARRYRLRTMTTRNALGEWFTLVFDDLDWVGEAAYDAAQTVSIELEEDTQRRRRNLKLVPAA